jgi:para-nitrobenzyl esterase
MRSELRPEEKDGIRTYWAVPYASLPDRFGPPGPAPTWDGVRDATRPGPTAPQATRTIAGADLSAVLGNGWERGPDYLNVNIWTPDPDAQGLPVLVYVHGGGFLSGSGHAAMFDGTQFAKDGVVLVTLNYRLGAAGWLDLPGAPRNRGLLDVLAALRWVRDNIAGFGGDPANVTLFGQSAGAILIPALLLTEPDAATLVRRVVSQSGGAHFFDPEQASRVTRAFAERLGVPATLEAISALTDEQLVEAAAGLNADTRIDRAMGTSPFKPVIDAEPGELTMPAIDLLIGTNADEGGLYVKEPVTDEDVMTAAIRRDPDPELLAGTYRARFERPVDQLSALLTDQFVLGSTTLAESHPGQVWSYRFSLGGRAVHCAELPYVFGPGAMHDAWVGFATAGDPGWPPYPHVNEDLGPGSRASGADSS